MCNPSGVLIARMVRRKCGFNHWKMHQEMGMEKVQTWLHFERKGKRYKSDDEDRLFSVFQKHAKGTPKEFLDMVKIAADVEEGRVLPADLPKKWKELIEEREDD